jgi:Flp pilus assembly pilin Flp
VIGRFFTCAGGCKHVLNLLPPRRSRSAPFTRLRGLNGAGASVIRLQSRRPSIIDVYEGMYRRSGWYSRLLSCRQGVSKIPDDENWGTGLDHALRRLVLVHGCWECMDTGELAEESRLRGVKVFSAPPAVLPLSHAPVADRTRPSERVFAPMPGQAMVEYAVIIAAIAVVAWGAYNIMGHDIGSMASGIDSSLTST